MQYHTVIQIEMTPDELGQFLDYRLAKALSNYTPPAPVEADLPELLTRKQTAQQLQVSLTTLHEWAKDTEDRGAILVPLKIKGRVLYRRASVLAALKEVRRFKLEKAGGAGKHDH